MFIRLIKSPFIFLWIVVNSFAIIIGLFAVWLFDPAYDHEAAMGANKELFEFLRR